MKALVTIASALALVGCTSTMQVLEGADYVCVNGNLDGMYTDSGATGRGIKVPDGFELTPDMITALCGR